LVSVFLPGFTFSSLRIPLVFQVGSFGGQVL